MYNPGMDSSEHAREMVRRKYEQMTAEERKAAASHAAKGRWGDEAETTKLARTEGISRQAAWARLNRAKKKGKKKRKKG